MIRPFAAPAIAIVEWALARPLKTMSLLGDYVASSYSAAQTPARCCDPKYCCDGSHDMASRHSRGICIESRIVERILVIRV